MHQLLAALAIQLDLITTLPMHCPKLLFGQGCLDCPVKVCLDDAPSGGLALPFGNDFAVVLSFALRVFDNGQAILLAQSVGAFPHTAIIGRRIVEF